MSHISPILWQFLVKWMTNFPLFPPEASKLASEMDALLFFEILVSLVGLTIVILLPMAYYLWMGWLLWAILLQISSLRHPQVAEWPRVSGVRMWLALLALLMLAVTLTPAPFGHASLPEFVRQVRGR